VGAADTRRFDQPPPGPAVGQTTPVAAPTDQPAEVKKKKKRRLRDPLSILLVLIIVVAIVIAGGIGVELYIRNKANNKIAAATACKVKDQATASFGVTPLVTWQVLTDHYTNISIETAGNQISDAKGMKLQLSIKDVKLDSTADSKGTIGAIDATLTWTATGIKQTVQNAIPILGEFVTSNVTTHPKDGTVELKGLLNDIVAKPQVKDGGLELQIVSFNTLGFSLPKESVQSTLDEYTSNLTKKLPLGIHADSVEVTDSDVVAKFSSRNATIPAGETDPCFADL
jgi:flagellar basal body-associated protein FliL